MKKIIQRIRIAATLAVLCAIGAGNAWGVTANVVWESDFGTTTKTGLDGKTYTLSLPDGSWLQDNGTIKIGSNDNGRGVLINITGAVSGQKISVLMEYANATAQSAVVPVYMAAGAWLGSQTKDSSLDVLGHWWNGNGTTYPTGNNPATITTMPKDGYFMYVFNQGSDVEIYSAEELSGLTGGAVAGLNTPNRMVTQISLGGVVGGDGESLTNRAVHEFTGLIIKRVAIFTSGLSASDVAAYKFPSEHDYVVTVSEPDTSWAAAFASTDWDDNADNSGKTVYLNIEDGASLTKDTALSVKNLIVTGTGELTVSGVVMATDGIHVGSGTTVTLSGDSSSAVTNYGTLNVNGCTVSGAIANYGTINTTGTTVIENSASQFYASGTLSVNGETTLRTANDPASDNGGLRGRIVINEGAKLISNYSAMPCYNAMLTLDLHGELALGNTVRWVVGGSTTVNVYSGGTVTGGDTLYSGLDWRQGGGTINVYSTVTFTAGIRARSGETITVNVNGSDVVFTTPVFGHAGTITKTGTGKMLRRIQNARWGGVALAGFDGVVRYSSQGDADGTSKEIFLNSSFDGILDVTTEGENNYVAFAWVGVSSFNNPVFSNRPTLQANGVIRLYHSTETRPFTVKDLSGSGYIKNFNTYDSSDLKYVDTLQTKDTTYSGSFVNETSAAGHPPALTVRGADDATAIYSLTLSGVSDTTGPLAIENNAKVVFSSTGKWSGGTVTVKSGGVLESQNSDSIAATLKVQKGATLKFANGVQLAATSYNWDDVSGELEDGEQIKIDISDIAPSATPVTLISSGVTVDCAKFTVTASQRTATLSVEDGALKATFSNYWTDGTWSGTPVQGDDATLTLSQNATLSVADALALGKVTIENVSGGDVTLTISGAGALTTGGWEIPVGVTVKTSTAMTISGNVTGGGVIDVPVGTVCSMNNVTCSAKVTVEGTLKTSGTTVLRNAENYIADGGSLDVVSGTTEFASPFVRQSSSEPATKGICGNLIVESGAEFTIAGADFNNLDPFATSTLDIAGTLNMGARQWQFGSNWTIILRNGAVINGNNGEPTYGDWGFLNNNNTIQVLGNASIAASLLLNQTTLDIAQDAILSISGDIVANSTSLTKAGTGTLKFTQDTLTKPMTISEGKVQLNKAFTSGLAISIASGAELELGVGQGSSDVTGISFANVTGNGTIRYSSTCTGYYTLPNADNKMFAGTLHVANDNTAAAGGVVVSKANGTTTIRMVTCAGNYRSDWGGKDEIADRYLEALQDCDATWSGIFTANDRLFGLKVAGVSGAANKTLTLSGTQTHINTLEVASTGSVNLTGTWKGDTTVSGTFGGTGTLRGNLTFSDGATFKAGASALTVSGVVTFPTEEGETVTVDLSGITLAATGTTLISGASTIGSTDNLTLSGAFFKVGDGENETKSLVVYPHVATYKGIKYATFEEAINAALADEGGEANLDQITVVDGTAELPVGYHISNGAVVRYPVAVVKNGAYLAAGYTDTVLQAIQAIYGADYTGAYDYIEIVSGSTFDLPLGVLAEIKVKNTVGATPIPDGIADDTSMSSSEGENYTTYTKVNEPTVYTWTGGFSEHRWENRSNWSYVNNSSETVTASRPPAAGDTVVFASAVSDLTISANTSVAAVSIGAAVTVSMEYDDEETLTATTGGIVLTDANASITVSGVTLSPEPTTTVANSYVKSVTADGTTTYSVEAYKTLTIVPNNSTVTVATNGVTVAGSSPYTLEAGTVTLTVAPTTGYLVGVVAVTSGSGTVTNNGNGTYSYTVTGDATAATITVMTAKLVGKVTFEYNASYTNATVTATVTADGTYTLTVNGRDYEATAANGSVTFENVDVSAVQLGETTTYSISYDGSQVASGNSEVKGNAVDGSAWMREDSAGRVGSWTHNGETSTLTYADTTATLTGTNIYTAAWMSTGEVVTVTTKVSFDNTADGSLTIDADAQAAITIASVASVNTFQVYAGSTPSWVSVYNDTLGVPKADTTYALTLTLNYATQTYGVSVGGFGALTNADGVASFPLAKGASAMQKVSYLGAGTFTSLAGSYVSAGYSADVGTDGNATNVVVSQSFVSQYLGDKLATQVSILLNPNATESAAIAKNGLNYFKCYALGLDPTREEDKPIVDVEVVDGEYVFTVKHYDAEGNLVEITPADNVSTSITLKYGTGVDEAQWESSDKTTENTIAPSELPFGDRNVIYYKAEVTIGAK